MNKMLSNTSPHLEQVASKRLNLSVISTEEEREVKRKADLFFADILNYRKSPQGTNALTNSGHMHSVAVAFNYWEDKLPEIINLYDPIELIDIYRSFDIARVFPSDRNLEMIDDKIEKNIDDVSPEYLSQLCHSLANTGRHIKNSFLSGIISRIDETKNEMDKHGLANSLFFLTVNSIIKNGKHPTSQMHELRGRLEGHPDLNDGGKRRIIQLSKCFDLACAHTIPNMPDNGSSLETAMRNLFKSLGYIESRQPTALKNHGNHVDLPLRHQGIRFLTEIDGPSHFMHQLKQDVFQPISIDGQTIIKTKVHSKLCPKDKVVRFPLLTCKYLLSDKGKKDAEIFIPQIFNGLAQVDPGAYFIDLEYADCDETPNLIAVDFFKLVQK